MRAYERFLNYVKIYTTSDPESTATPTAARERDLALLLVDELKAMGIADARVDEKSYVYATLPATPGLEQKDAIGFIAHLDTAPDAPGENVRPVLHENYDGGDVALGSITLSPAMFPHLAQMKGKTLITTDGTTLLGADDKAGIAEIMTMLERVMGDGIAHPKLCIAFTPDEEVGAGADHFDVSGFGAKYAYTVDGDAPGLIEYETFNAADATFEIQGVSVHPGSATGIMVNAGLIAAELAMMLPQNETPTTTQEREGFYHLCSLKGKVESAVLEYIVRDHDREKFEARKAFCAEVAETLNQKYGEGTVKVTLTDSYYNMAEKIEPCFFLVENALEVCRALGLDARCEPVRGGTDGSRLSFMGLPCPNLPTGGRAFHGPYEHITIEDMDICVETLLGLVKKYAE